MAFSAFLARRVLALREMNQARERKIMMMIDDQDHDDEPLYHAGALLCCNCWEWGWWRVACGVCRGCWCCIDSGCCGSGSCSRRATLSECRDVRQALESVTRLLPIDNLRCHIPWPFCSQNLPYSCTLRPHDGPWTPELGAIFRLLTSYLL